MQRKARILCMALAAIMMVPLLAAPVAARASEEGRRNTTLGLGALSAYLFTRGGNKLPAFVALGATGYAYKRYDDAIRARHRREAYRRRLLRSRRYHRHYTVRRAYRR